MTKIYSGCGCEVIEYFPNFCAECRIAELEALKVLEKAWAKQQKVRVRGLKAEVKRLEATIDALMLEYCPAEMTPEQIDKWGKNQRPIKEQPNGS